MYFKIYKFYLLFFTYTNGVCETMFFFSTFAVEKSVDITGKSAIKLVEIKMPSLKVIHLRWAKINSSAKKLQKLTDVCMVEEKVEPPHGHPIVQMSVKLHNVEELYLC